MSEKKKYFWNRIFGNPQKFWNDPRWFFPCFAAFLFSCVIVIFGFGESPSYIQRITGIVLFFCFLLAIIAFVLALIPWTRIPLFWMLRHRFKLLAMVSFVTVLFYFEENWRGKHAWDNYCRKWEASGVRFDLVGMSPPPVPEEQNFALTPIVYSSYGGVLTKDGKRISPENANLVNRLDLRIVQDPERQPTNLVFGSWYTTTLTDLKVWQDYYRHPEQFLPLPHANSNCQFPISIQSNTPARNVLQALSKHDNAIEELRAAAQLPYSRFPLEYDCQEAAGMLLPHLQALKGAATTLELRVIAELEVGESDKALADTKLAFRLSEAVHNEPILVSHLIRISIHKVLSQIIWEGLARHSWSSAQIVELQGLLAHQDFLAEFEQGMRGETVFCNMITDYMRRERNPGYLKGLLKIGDSDNSPSLSDVLILLDYLFIPDGWYYQTELRFAQMQQEWVIPAVDLRHRIASPTSNRQMNSKLFSAGKNLSANLMQNVLIISLCSGIQEAHKKFATAQAQLDLTQTACALERYKLANGNYPNSLDALAPQFIAQVPHDVIDGKPLHYERTANGQFVLYSIGWNEKDDGGVVGRKESGSSADIERGDWVWRYPASR
ncbi:MAG: hypothetical protein NTZ16_04390 [Verrucomicrobia bacterium]|nr:hypothetical protein [Verrucomicrobiota bacterium]